MAKEELNQVRFLHGLQSALPTTQDKIKAGTFYLTDDTHRLYVGQNIKDAQGNDKKDLVLLNQTINIVNSIAELTALDAEWRANGTQASHVQDFYYILGTDDENALNTHKGNILAAYAYKNGQYLWVQINPDTDVHVSDFSFDVDGEKNSVSLFSTVTNNDNTHTEDEVLFTAGKNKANKESVNITFVEGSEKKDGTRVTTPEIKITGDTYSVSRSALTTDTATFTLASELKQGDSSISIKAGSNVSIAADGDNGIAISAADSWKPVASASGLDINEDGTVTVTIKDAAGVGVEFTSSDAISFTVGEKKETVVAGGHLDVYTTDEVDDLLKNLDSMKYCGTIAISGDSTAEYLMDSNHKLVKPGETTPIALHNGDTFKVIEQLSYKDAEGDKTYFASFGDVLIATGTEVDGALTDVVWTYIPSGDEAVVDTRYTFTPIIADNKLDIDSTTTAAGGSIQIVGGNQLTATSATGATANDLVVTLNHDTITQAQTVSNEGTLGANDTLTAISNVKVDAYGHVTGLETDTFTLPAYALDEVVLTDNAVKAGNTKVSSSVEISNAIIKDGASDSEAVYNLKSESLDIAVEMDGDEATNNIVVELKWGSF